MKIHFVLSVNVIFLTFSTGEECPNVSGGCCEGFFRDYVENKCKECLPGYYSINCTEPCEQGFFGRRCLEKCKCDSEERCHHVDGCVDKDNTKTSLGTFSIGATTQITIEAETNTTVTATVDKARETTTFLSYQTPNTSGINNNSQDQQFLVKSLLLFTIPTFVIGMVIVLVITVVRKMFVCTITRKTPDEIVINPYIETQVGEIYEEIDDNVLNANLNENERKHNNSLSNDNDCTEPKVLSDESKPEETHCPKPCHSTGSESTPANRGIVQENISINDLDLTNGNFKHGVGCSVTESNYLTPSNDSFDHENKNLTESKNESFDVNDELSDSADDYHDYSDYLDPVDDCHILPDSYQDDSYECIYPKQSESEKENDQSNNEIKEYITSSNKDSSIEKNINPYQALDADWQKNTHIYNTANDENPFLNTSSPLNYNSDQTVVALQDVVIV